MEEAGRKHYEEALNSKHNRGNRTIVGKVCVDKIDYKRDGVQSPSLLMWLDMKSVHEGV